MKRKLFLLAIVFLSVGLFSQTIDDIPISDLNSTYIQIVGEEQSNGEVEIYINYGQKQKVLKHKKRLKDNNGKDVRFYSMIDALNYFDEYGYDFVNAYVITIKNENVYHYLLKKRE